MSDSAPEKPNILAVDDDESIRELLKATLTRQGFRVFLADGGKAMDAVLADTRIDLIVLDSMMPGEDGLAICERLSQNNGPPIIMLSARGDDVARIKGLNLGAEDYMAKPFNSDELGLRIRKVLRRTPGSVRDEADITRFFGWSLDNRTRRLTSPADKMLILSAAEFAVLHVFLAQRDRPLRRDQVVERMSEMHDDSTDRSLDTLISRLRRKLKHIAPEGEDDVIQTVYGVGYMFRPVR
ncbi:response regulator [Asticcacaulis sp. AC402]|uniref:response regulator n=1 Tax=Asticcacaulis sp. AC402 TaxID=1282361 RepID=UPI0003C3EFF3|nr:response regulator [Asticcacaulis sp. AC402]ESQ75488.1 response regulator [Asticcacaulis sp. AC402]